MSYNRLFSGESATCRGTLYNVKQVFNFRNVKGNSNECFNEASAMLQLTGEGLILLLAMKELHISDPNTIPQGDNLSSFQ